jgi:hypothetical protein
LSAIKLAAVSAANGCHSPFWKFGQASAADKFGVEDYSPAAKTDFRRRLRTKYKTKKFCATHGAIQSYI